MPKGGKGNKSGAAAANGAVAVTKELWQAAVNLRGAVEPADYKRYVLPIIFLRFLSLGYERRRAELEAEIANPQSEYYENTAALEDPDEYRLAGAFLIPERARWASIVRNARADDVRVQLDEILDLLEKAYPQQLNGLLPKVFSGSNLDRENVAGLIDLFSRDIFKEDHGGGDLLGTVYQYFIGEFASSEGKRGGEFFTVLCIVRLLVAMLEPTAGKVFDPCGGSGGMFVQSDVFTKHSGNLSFFGQESKDFTYRLCRMNLFIHGIEGDIQLGNSYFDDKHAGLRADHILANPPFNDGSKGEAGWGAQRIADADPRVAIGGEKMPLAARNANTMWIMHFWSHLAEGGTAGFVMATGELSNSEAARVAVRKALVEHDCVDCIVQLPGQLFANTQISCSLWFLSKNRDGTGGFRRRKGEILFIDGREMGALIAGSRKQKELSDGEIERIAGVYRTFRREGRPEDVAGFCRVAMIDEVRDQGYYLTPGRYVGAEDTEDEGEDLKQRMPRLMAELHGQFSESETLSREILQALAEFDGQQ